VRKMNGRKTSRAVQKIDLISMAQNISSTSGRNEEIIGGMRALPKAAQFGIEKSTASPTLQQTHSPTPRQYDCKHSGGVPTIL
jgi:BRCT domain type II-containing protein